MALSWGAPFIMALPVNQSNVKMLANNGKGLHSSLQSLTSVPMQHSYLHQNNYSFDDNPSPPPFFFTPVGVLSVSSPNRATSYSCLTYVNTPLPHLHLILSYPQCSKSNSFFIIYNLLTLIKRNKNPKEQTKKTRKTII